MRSQILPKRIEDPMKQILKEAREIWDHDGTRPCVRESFSRMIECRTPALGWLTYASETEVMRVYHTCKARFCPSCGYRATLQWQREQWTQLPVLLLRSCSYYARLSVAYFQREPPLIA
jgi:hypothetical protein